MYKITSDGFLFYFDCFFYLPRKTFVYITPLQIVYKRRKKDCLNACKQQHQNIAKVSISLTHNNVASIFAKL